MDGEDLKILLARHGYSAEKLADLLGKGRRTVYDWFAKPALKKGLIARISEVTGIPIKEFQPNLHIVKPSAGGDENEHHGQNIQSILKQKGISKESFAKKMQFTRQTLYRRCGESTWPDAELLQAAEILQVPVAQIKGFGEGQKAFEKDIYLQLAELKKMIQEIHDKLLK